MYIYAEYLLLENLIMNYIILYVTHRFTKTETSKIRLFIAASLGALYTLVIFFPSLFFMTRFIVKMSISILIVIIAFNPAKWSKFIKLFATFYVMSFIFAGAALGLFYLTSVKFYVGKGIFYVKEFPFKILLLSSVLAYGLIKVTWSFVQTRLYKEDMYVPITILLNGKSSKIIALMDTGNSLKDPISNIPVIIVQFSAVKDLLPPKIQGVFNKYKEDNLNVISNVMAESVHELNFRLIPFKSLGKDNGMLLGFRPDKVIVDYEDEKEIDEIVVGIYNNTLSNEDDYRALLHPEVLN